MHGAASYIHAEHGNPLNRGTGAALALNAIVALVAVLVVNALMFASIGQSPWAVSTTAPLATTGALATIAWALIFPMWGAARWHAWQSCRRGQRESRWIVALIAAGTIALVASVLADARVRLAVDGVMLAIAITAALRVRPLSHSALRLLVPSIVWIALSAALSLIAVVYR